jgi:Integrase core domain
VRIVLIPVRAPNANASAERIVRSIREECLDRLILFGERRLFRALDEFVAHYHRERKHYGLASAAYVLESGRVVVSGPASVLRSEQLIKEFYLGRKRTTGPSRTRS